MISDHIPRSFSDHSLDPAVPKANSDSDSVTEHTLQRLHDNLDTRIRLFWTTAMANRMVHLSVFCPPSGEIPSNMNDTLQGHDTDFTPLATTSSVTSSEGFFQSTIHIPWERLATHPPSLHVAFGERDSEYPVIVQAEMWPPVSLTPAPTSSNPYATYQRRTPSFTGSTATGVAIESSSSSLVNAAGRNPIRTQITVVLPNQRVPIRIISDIDDTVKHTGIVDGAKAAFTTAFTRHLSDLVIPDMVKWYNALSHKGKFPNKHFY